MPQSAVRCILRHVGLVLIHRCLDLLVVVRCHKWDTRLPLRFGGVRDGEFVVEKGAALGACKFVGMSGSRLRLMRTSGELRREWGASRDE